MALQNVTLTFQAKRTNGTSLYTSPLTSTKPTRSAAEADIAAQIQVRVDNAQATSQDELDAQAAFAG
jgi:hypothetical protein